MGKDRLNELKQEAKKKKNVAIEIEDNAEANNLKSTFEKSDVIRQWIDAIEKNLVEIRGYLKNSNSIEFNRKNIQSKLESLFQNNATISHKIQNKLKEFDNELKDVNISSVEGRIKTIQSNTLKTSFQKILEQNSIELENYKRVQKNVLKAQIAAKRVVVTDEELDALLTEGVDVQLFTDNLLAETQNAKAMLADIEERHSQLLKIEKMLTEVRDLFLQLAILVDNQQELLNRVEYQAQQATDYVHAVDLETPRKLRVKHLKCKIWCCVVLVLVIVIILILVFK